MPHSKYGRYVAREIIWESKYKQITCPTAYYRGCPGGGNAIEAEWSCITSPLTMDQEPELDAERDRFLLFSSANVNDGKEFEAECELALGPKGKKFVITKPTLVYLPKGLWHGPVTVKNVKKPFALLNWSLQPELSTSWEAPDDSDYVIDVYKNAFSLVDIVGGGPDMPPDVIAGHPGKPFRHLRNAMGGGLAYLLWGSDLGIPAKASWCSIATFKREYCYLEPFHAHRRSHQVSMYLGGNPLDIEDFGGDIDVFFGKEKERQTLNTSGVVHYVPGIPHMGDEVRVVNQPFLRIMWVVGPEMNNYYKAAPVDKVQFGDEWGGDVMITPGADDYVPPTPIDEWVWPYPDEEK
jgi:hypothetical protein